MRDIPKGIRDNLDEIENKYDVKILLAVESGSRAWGFASPDSDYDVRFIYVHQPAEYLRIDPMKDVIEWQLDEVLDINGWDIRKALLAFGKGNPNVMEWANSPIIYRKAEEWDGLKETVMRYFSEKSALCHYYGTANSTLQGFLSGDMIRYKKYFYALRPLLCCRWIERYHTVPPMEFDKLLTMFNVPDDVLTQELYTAIQRRLPVTGGCAQDDPLSEHRGGISGWQLEKAPAEIFRMGVARAPRPQAPRASRTEMDCADSSS